MKATIVIVLFIVGALLGPQTAPSIDNPTNRATPAIAVTVPQVQTSDRVLNDTEMEATVGANESGCAQYIDANGDRIGMCCLDLWIFKICAAVNLSAVERLMSF